MPKRTDDFDSWQLEKLSDPALAARYLSAVLENSPEQFVAALGTVARAHHISTIAEQAGTARETIYRSFSEEGNPGWKMLSAVMKALQVEFQGIKRRNAEHTPSSPVQPKTAKRKAGSKQSYLNAMGQNCFAFMTEPSAALPKNSGTIARTINRSSGISAGSYELIEMNQRRENPPDWQSINPMIANALNNQNMNATGIA